MCMVLVHNLLYTTRVGTFIKKQIRLKQETFPILGNEMQNNGQSQAAVPTAFLGTTEQADSHQWSNTLQLVCLVSLL